VLKATGHKDKVMIRETIDMVLGKVGLKNKGHKMPYEMSGGEQQRVDIARALLNKPKLILADEPTGNLDPDTSDEIMQLLFSICRDYQAAVVMATHDYSLIQKYPARVVKVEGGSVREITAAGMA
jgi:cell division transport system ATP-binding protein